MTIVDVRGIIVDSRGYELQEGIMRFWRIFRHRIRSLFRRARVEAELEREISLHYEQLVRENVEAGMDESDARQAARRALGNVPLLAERCRDHRRMRWLNDLAKDFVYAAY